MTYTTWNPSDKYSTITLSNGNLTASNPTGSSGGVRSVDCQTSGKFYFEYTCTTQGWSYDFVGLANGTAVLNTNPYSAVYGSGVVGVFESGYIWMEGGDVGYLGATISAGTIVCVAVDLTARYIWFRAGATGLWNGSSTADPASGAGGVPLSGADGGAFNVYAYVFSGTASDSVTANFGASAFAGSVPTGFNSGFTSGSALATSSLVTQVSFESWYTNNPYAQVTQVAMEEWVSVASIAVHADVTQVALEVWCSVALKTSLTGASLLLGL